MSTLDAALFDLVDQSKHRGLARTGSELVVQLAICRIELDDALETGELFEGYLPGLVERHALDLRPRYS